MFHVNGQINTIQASGSFPDGSDGKESASKAGDLDSSLGWEDPLEKEMATHPEFLPGEPHEQRGLVGYSPGGHKELDITE